MIGEFERYHGAVVRDLVVGLGRALNIEASDDLGRVNTFIVNGDFAIYIKHSTHRLPPWQFTYDDAQLDEIARLEVRGKRVWLIHVCGQDGFASLSLDEFRAINPVDADTTRFVRVDRNRNTMYRVNGTGGSLGRPKRRGLQCVIDDIKG